MARKLSAQAWLDRAIIREGSLKAVAAKLGRSSSTLSDIKSGRRPGENLREALRDVSKGKREVIAPPVRRATPRPQPQPQPQPRLLPTRLSPMERAEAQLAKFDDKVVITVTNKETGVSNVLCSKGGVAVETIESYSGGIGGFCAAQYASQGYEDDDGGGADFFDMYDVDFEDYD